MSSALMAPLVSLCIALLVGSTASIADTDAGIAASGHSTKEVSSSAASFFHSSLSLSTPTPPPLSLSLSLVIPSAQPICPQTHQPRCNGKGTNTIFVSQADEAGLDDRQSIIRPWIDLAFALCAKLVLAPPSEMIAPVHTHGVRLSTTIDWDRYFTFNKSRSDVVIGKAARAKAAEVAKLAEVQIKPSVSPAQIKDCDRHSWDPKKCRFHCFQAWDLKKCTAAAKLLPGQCGQRNLKFIEERGSDCILSDFGAEFKAVLDANAQGKSWTWHSMEDHWRVKKMATGVYTEEHKKHPAYLCMSYHTELHYAELPHGHAYTANKKIQSAALAILAKEGIAQGAGYRTLHVRHGFLKGGAVQMECDTSAPAIEKLAKAWLYPPSENPLPIALFYDVANADYPRDAQLAVLRRVNTPGRVIDAETAIVEWVRANEMGPNEKIPDDILSYLIGEEIQRGAGHRTRRFGHRGQCAKMSDEMKAMIRHHHHPSKEMKERADDAHIVSLTKVAVQPVSIVVPHATAVMADLEAALELEEGMLPPRHNSQWGPRDYEGTGGLVTKLLHMNGFSQARADYKCGVTVDYAGCNPLGERTCCEHDTCNAKPSKLCDGHDHGLSNAHTCNGDAWTTHDLAAYRAHSQTPWLCVSRDHPQLDGLVKELLALQKN